MDMLHKLRSKSITDSITTANKTIGSKSNISAHSQNNNNNNNNNNNTTNTNGGDDNDDYSLRDENDTLSAAMMEGKDITNEPIQYVDGANHIVIDSATQSMGNSRRSLDSNISFPLSKSDNDDDDQQNKQNVTDASLALERTTTRLWSPKMKFQRRKIVREYLRLILCYGIFVFTVLMFVWGVVYHTDTHYRKIKIIAVLQDDPLPSSYSSSSLNIQPVTDIFPTLIDEAQGDWHVYNESSFKSKYNLQTTQEIDDKIAKLVYDEHYWIGLNVKPNITTSMVDSIIIQNQPAFNATDHFQIIYEAGRDPSHVAVWMVPRVTEVETAFNQYCMDTYIPSLINNVTTANPSTTINWGNVAAMMNMKFQSIDLRPFYDRIILVSSQVGGIFAMLLTIFQFLINGRLHAQVAPLLRQRSRIYYRIIIAALTHFFASLFWCTVSAMYQVDFTIKYGRGGFMIYWMTMWMFMWTCGSINENVIAILFSVYPQFLGFWILTFSVTNISTGFFPMTLNNNFYRIGYALPLRNMIDLHRSLLLGTSNRPEKLGRCYGVFTAWIVVNTALLPFVMKLSKRLALWKAKRNAKELAKEKEMMKQYR